MWLLDANMDVHLASLLAELGIASETAAAKGWKALSNGQLVAAAVSSGFDCLLTRDRLFGESAENRHLTPYGFIQRSLSFWSTCRSNVGRSTASASWRPGPHPQ
jgi:hypothetical protein